MKTPWQQRTIVFIVDKNAKSVSRNKLTKILIQEKKNILLFSSFWVKFSLLIVKNYRHGCQNCNLRIFSRFWGKTFISYNWTWCQTSSDFVMKKMGLSIKEFFSGFNQQKFALPEKYFDEKRFLFRKCFLFLLSFLEFQWFLCLFAKLFSLVGQTTDQRRERKQLGKITWKTCFFNHFWTLRRKNLDFQQNCKAWFSKP